MKNYPLLILTLHRVGTPPAEATLKGLFTSPRLLRFQIKLLSWLGFSFSTLEEAISSREGRTAVITFDDGYRDNYELGVPTLNDLRVPATVFMITDDVGKHDLVWEEAGDQTPADMLTWDELAEMADHGWEVGAHSSCHIHLARRSLSEQTQSITGCLDRIEERLGRRPVSFSYPYGSYSNTTKAILRSEGVRYGVTTKKPSPGEVCPASDHLELKRLAVGGWAWHHYLRVLLRTLAVVGVTGLSKAVFKYSSEPTRLFPETVWSGGYRSARNASIASMRTAENPR